LFVMNGRQRNATNAQIWGNQNDSNYDGNCTSRHCQSGTYVIPGRLVFVEQSVHSTNPKQVNTLDKEQYYIHTLVVSKIN
jgi:hypothetical protein